LEFELVKKALPFKDRKGLGARLKKLREVRGLSKVAIGGLLGVSDTAVGKWEGGTTEPPISCIAYWIESGGVDPCWLLYGEGEIKMEDNNWKDKYFKLLEDYKTLSDKYTSLLEETEKGKTAASQTAESARSSENTGEPDIKEPRRGSVENPMSVTEFYDEFHKIKK